MNLTDEEQRMVNEERDSHPDPHVRRKMLVLWTLHCGLKRRQAANVAAVGLATVQRYVAAYRDGGLLGSVNSAHALTALWSILMMNIGLMGIIYRAEKRFLLIEPDSLLMIISYVLGLWLLFR